MPRPQERLQQQTVVQSVPVVRLVGTRDLHAREQAQSLWARLEDVAGRLPAGGVVLVNLAGASRVGAGFLDALLQVIRAARGRHPGRFMVVGLGADQAYVVDSLEFILARSPAALPVLMDGTVRVLGRLTRAMEETYQVVGAAGQVTSANVARLLHVRPSAAANRLRELYDLGVVSRREEVATRHGGRRFVYVPVPDPAALREERT